MPADLRTVKTFPQLLKYLRDELLWPIESDDAEELSFEYAPADFAALAPEHHVQIDKILQIRPLVTGQPWGIFYVQFKKARLPVVVLRELLASLVFKKRESANKSERPAWDCHDLLFISSYGQDGDQRHLNFAHFSDSPNGSHLPALRVLDWDEDDTDRALKRLDSTLHEKLRWPEDDSNLEKWREQWSAAFQRGLRYPIRKAEQLAHALAALAQNIRRSVLAQMAVESERGKLRTLHAAFKATLIQDLEPKQFADMFAQTVAYGLFTNATRRTVAGAGTAITADGAVESITSLSPFLRDLLDEFLSVGGRRRGGLDYDKLGVNEVVDLLNADSTDLNAVLDDFGHKKRDEDPVIHFYETFLEVYDKEEKVRRGVFYTPQPVVSYIVRSVNELLQSEFGLPHGLASTETWGEMTKRIKGLTLPNISQDAEKPKPLSADEFFVQVLDPATGTATFLVETIAVIHRHLKTSWETGGGLGAMPEIHHKPADKVAPKTFGEFWNLYVPTSLLPRLYGYELMMAPYAIAHMKVALKLADTGFTAWKELAANDRVCIYLTNALEPASKQAALTGFEALAHEAQAVNEVKLYKRFTAIVGNPPYSPSICEPEWLMRRLDDWKQGLNEAKSDINREEWKFLRLAQHHCQSTGAGVVGFIINRDFLDGIAKRRMREHLGQSFPLRVVVDLNGDVKGNIADENVFEIEQGVTVAVFCTRSAKQVLRFTSRVGTRAQKYADLIEKEPIDAAFAEFEPGAPYFRWLPGASTTAAGAGAEYSQWAPLDSVFTLKSSGIQTKNDPICIGWSANEVFERVERLAKLSAKDARTEFEIEGEGAWTIVNAQADLRRFGISRKNVRAILYRPLDFRFTYYTHKSGGFLGRPRYDLMRHMIDGRNIGLIFNRQIVGDSVTHFFVTRDLTCHGTFYLGNKGQDYLAPLYLHEDDLLSKKDGSGAQNFTPAFAASLRVALGDVAARLTPEEIFNYCYAVFHSPGYRSRYAEFLKIDFPRLPLTKNLELFRELARLGGELTPLHLLESSTLNRPITEYLGGRAPEVEKVSWSDNTVWLDKDQTTGFKGVRENVWNFYIGGYQVCEKWLKDRKGRNLSADDRTHYQKIIVALSETIRLMAEIDKVIDQHGGWPGAFAGSVTADDSAPASDAAKAPPPPAPQDLGIQTEDELPLG